MRYSNNNRSVIRVCVRATRLWRNSILFLKQMRIRYLIPKKIRKELVADSIKLADSIRVDELDCKRSFSRQDTKLSVDEVIKKGEENTNTMYNFIFCPAICSEPAYYDVGLSTMNIGVNYFLWITVSVFNGQSLIDKFKLEEYK